MLGATMPTVMGPPGGGGPTGKPGGGAPMGGGVPPAYRPGMMGAAGPSPGTGGMAGAMGPRPVMPTAAPAMPMTGMQGMTPTGMPAAAPGFVPRPVAPIQHTGLAPQMQLAYALRNGVQR